jgi:group I intron endonuclease
MIGYKHTEEALLKMITRYKDKKNQPFFGKTHTEEIKKLISKPGAANPMFGKKHSEKSKLLMSIKKKIKTLLGWGFMI